MDWRVISRVTSKGWSMSGSFFGEISSKVRGENDLEDLNGQSHLQIKLVVNENLNT